MNKRKGFTLIELLVVIAIIGILSTIVLINLNTARSKAKDAAIKGALSEARAAAEMYYDTAGNYTGFCGQGATTDYGRIKTNVEANGGTVTCNALATAYCVQSPLTATGAGSWCVDSTGISGSTSIACDATAADCI